MRAKKIKVFGRFEIVSLDCLTLAKKAVGSFETSVTICQSTWHLH